MRSLIAFLIAPLPGAVLMLFLLPGRAAAGGQASLALLLFYALLLVAQLVIGWPLRYFVARGERSSWTAHIMIGAAMTAIPIVPLSVWAHSRGVPAPQLIRAAGVFVAAGVVTGIMYLVAVGSPGSRRKQRLADLNRRFN